MLLESPPIYTLWCSIIQMQLVHFLVLPFSGFGPVHFSAAPATCRASPTRAPVGEKNDSNTEKSVSDRHRSPQMSHPGTLTPPFRSLLAASQSQELPDRLFTRQATLLTPQVVQQQNV